MSTTEPLPGGRPTTAPARKPAYLPPHISLDYMFAEALGGYLEFIFLTTGVKLKGAVICAYSGLAPGYARTTGDVLSRSGMQAVTYDHEPPYRISEWARRGNGRAALLLISRVRADLDYERGRGSAAKVLIYIPDVPISISVAISSGYGYRTYTLFRTPFRPNKPVTWCGNLSQHYLSTTLPYLTTNQETFVELQLRGEPA